MSTASKLHAHGGADGRIEFLEIQLAERFGPLPSHSHARIRSASIAELERFAKNVLRARRLDDVFDA